MVTRLRQIGQGRGRGWLARTGTIPGTRVGKEWRFARASLIQFSEKGAEDACFQKRTNFAKECLAFDPTKG
jgi:hypothetical protein